MIEAESRPGSPSRINLGSNYAQPTSSFEAIASGNELDRITSYLGNRNACAPWTSDEERQAQHSTETGRAAQNPRDAEKQLLMRTYAMRDKDALAIFGLGSVYT